MRVKTGRKLSSVHTLGEGRAGALGHQHKEMVLAVKNPVNVGDDKDLGLIPG